jgi:hypothetical protein
MTSGLNRGFQAKDLVSWHDPPRKQMAACVIKETLSEAPESGLADLLPRWYL